MAVWLAVQVTRFLHLEPPLVENILSFLIVSVLGFGPALEIYRRRNFDRMFLRSGSWLRQKPAGPKARWGFRIIALLLYVYLDVFLFAMLLAMAVLLVAVPLVLVYWILRLPPHPPPPEMSAPLLIVALAVIVIWSFNPHPFGSPRRSFSEIAVDLRLAWPEIWQFFAKVLVGIESLRAFFAGYLGPLPVEMIAAALTGAFVGFSIYRPERDRALGLLILLGKARTLMRLGRHAEARFAIHMVGNAANWGAPEALLDMAEVLDDLEYRCERRLLYLVQPLSVLYGNARAGELLLDESWHGAWLDGVRKTISLTWLVAAREGL